MSDRAMTHAFRLIFGALAMGVLAILAGIIEAITVAGFALVLGGIVVALILMYAVGAVILAIITRNG